MLFLLFLLTHFLLEDGHTRAALVINRQLPGPSIRVCHHDRVVVYVVNRLISDTGVTIHWHGQDQRETPYMDGVAKITQCPIAAGSSFIYNFTADDAGTHWYHSHAGIQQADGAYGAFVVKQSAAADPHSGEFDVDEAKHVIVVQDWIRSITMERFLKYTLIDEST